MASQFEIIMDELRANRAELRRVEAGLHQRITENSKERRADIAALAAKVESTDKDLTKLSTKVKVWAGLASALFAGAIALLKELVVK